MAHYALLDENNVVVSVFVGRDEDDLPDGITDWEEYYSPEGQVVKRTSYNTLDGVHLLGGIPFRGTFALPGYVYDPVQDIFYNPEPPEVGP